MAFDKQKVVCHKETACVIISGGALPQGPENYPAADRNMGNRPMQTIQAYWVVGDTDVIMQYLWARAMPTAMCWT